LTLPTDADERKRTPIFSGVMRYFPDAMAEVASCSWVGNEQHHPGEALWWDKSKSTDEHDALVRHLMEAGTTDSDGVRHSAKVAWRALAALQREIDAEAKEADPPPRTRQWVALLNWYAVNPGNLVRYVAWNGDTLYQGKVDRYTARGNMVYFESAPEQGYATDAYGWQLFQ